MNPQNTAAGWNPFMLMLNPEQVLAAVERSEKLGRLASRTCHPLDKPAPVAGTAKKPGTDSALDD